MKNQNLQTAKYSILKQAEGGATAVPDLCRNTLSVQLHFISGVLGMLGELEAKNSRLKKMYAKERQKAEILKEAPRKK